MPYTVKQLASLTGLTPRTLRYYDAIGLLRPARDGANDGLLDAPGFDRAAVLRERLRQLQSQRQQVEAMICTVRRTLSMLEGGDSMTFIYISGKK